MHLPHPHSGEKKLQISRRAANTFLTIAAIAKFLDAGGNSVAIAENAPTDMQINATNNNLGSVHTWTVVNYTRQPVWGEMHKQDGQFTSEIILEPANSLKPNARAETQQVDAGIMYKEYSWGRFCYKNNFWNLSRSANNSTIFQVYPIGVDGSELAMDSQKGRETLIKTDAC